MGPSAHGMSRTRPPALPDRQLCCNLIAPSKPSQQSLSLTLSQMPSRCIPDPPHTHGRQDAGTCLAHTSTDRQGQPWSCAVHGGQIRCDPEGPLGGGGWAALAGRGRSGLVASSPLSPRALLVHTVGLCSWNVISDTNERIRITRGCFLICNYLEKGIKQDNKASSVR